MCRSDLQSSSPRRLTGVLPALSLALLLAPAASQAWDPAKTPVTPVPQARWGALEPRGILGDQSAFSYHSDPKQNEPFWFAVDIENGWVFSVTGRGLQVFDARTNPGEPSLVGYGYGPHPTTQGNGGTMPEWNHSDEDFFLKDLDAPPNVDSMVAVAGREQGFVVWNTSAKATPVVHYQDASLAAMAVYSATIGGRHYAFAVTGAGVYLYDLSAAQTLSNCLDHSPGTLVCSGVYRGKLPGVGGGEYIHGAGNYIIVGRFGNGFQIWNVATPTAPVQVMNATSNWSYGVALWQSGSSYYAASVDQTGKLRTYDVSCIASGLCSQPGPLATVNVPGGSAPLTFVTLSYSGATPYVHVGGDDTFSCAVQREYLFKMTNPAVPEDVTPHGNAAGYWGWYYEGCSTGFNWVSPRKGKFSGEYFYRSAYSVLDVHKLGGPHPPVANFSWSPSEVYPGIDVTFSDLSTGAPTVWTWSFEDGAPPVAVTQNPVVQFGSQGPKSVTLISQNAVAPSDQVAKTVTVLDPAPHVASVSVSPANPVQCQPITFTANGATGRPALAFGWDITNTGGTSVNTGSGNPYTWNTALNVPLPAPGTYTGTVTVSNAFGPPATASAQFDLAGLTALPGAGTFSPGCTNCDAPTPPTPPAPPADTVLFSANVPGATEWAWDFTGSGSFGAFSSDPATGPSPSHAYTPAEVIARCGSTGGVPNVPCTFPVKVKVRNCVEGERDSAAFSVQIKQLIPLHAGFTIDGTCNQLEGQLFCGARTGVAISFPDSSTGADTWEYDWDGNGTYEESSITGPVLTHIYAAAGKFRPVLRVRRGASETDVSALTKSGLPALVDVEAAQPASIAINGPSSGQPNANLAFSATATNCTPASSWSWSADGGGTVTGTGASVTIKWTTTGNKNVSVTNSACPNATGTKSVTISTTPPPPPPPPPPPLGTLDARFTVSPIAPNVGQTVTFDGSSSLGSPTGYTWNFGDGSPLGSGVQATHVYALAGSYQVTLSIVNVNKTCGLFFCEHSSTKTLVVSSGVPAPVAAFTTSATCKQEFSLVTCDAVVGQAVSFTDTSTGGSVVTRTWDFGDGQTATEAAVTHTFTKPGSYNVGLTVGNTGGSTNEVRTFVVTPAPKSKSIVLPWIAQTRGALVQSSDLYLHNPGDQDLDVVVTFLRRGTSEANPPQVPLTIKAHATLFYTDVIKELFNRENTSGYITVEPKGDGLSPIITSFNTTVQSDGSKFGQTITGAALVSSPLPASTGEPVRHLVGLNATTEKLAYLGVSNPNDTAATYRLKFFDKLGKKVSESGDLVVERFGQTQFQPKQLESQFGVANLDDYRVEVRVVDPVQLFPYGANVRLASTDPSFVAGGAADAAEVHLVGVYGTAGLKGSKWQTDVVLGNSSEEVVITDVTFRGVGVSTPPEDTLHITLQPRETKRIENILKALWGLDNAVGVLSFVSDSPSHVYPTIVGEVYDNANPSRRFGQSMQARAIDEAAGAGQSQHLIGLRQDAEYRSTISIANPSSEYALYDVIYRRLDGTPIQTLADQVLGPGRSRQFNPSHHPLPAAGVADGFSVEIKVKSGKLFAGGQVVNNKTNDPAFIDGETR